MMARDTEAHTDEELACLSITDTWYFGILVVRYEARLRRYIARLGRFSSEDIEDLLQNIFIKVYQNLNAFDSSLKFSSWIYRIAHNEAISFFRHAHVRPHGHLVDASEEIIGMLMSDTDLEKEIEANDAERILTEAIDELPVKYREVVILYYFEHKRYEDISDILRIPQGTVAVRLNRAKEKLKAIMSTNGYDHV